MKLTEILKPECIVVPLYAQDKFDAIRKLVETLAIHGACRPAEKLLKAVCDREALRSTGIGKGLAVPHGKSDACTQLVMALGKPAQPLDFNSIDGQPVSIVVLLGSPHDQTGPHIQALARISRLMLMDRFRAAIADANSPQEIYAAVARFEDEVR